MVLLKHGGSNKGDDASDGQRDEEIDDQYMFGDEDTADTSDGQRDEKTGDKGMSSDCETCDMGLSLVGDHSVDTVYKGSDSENVVEKKERPDKKPTIKKDKDDARSTKPIKETKSKKNQSCIPDFRGGVWMCLRCHFSIKDDGDDICPGKCQATTLGGCPANAFKIEEGAAAHFMHPKRDSSFLPLHYFDFLSILFPN